MTSETYPSEWRQVRLGDCCRVVSGATPRRDTPRYWGGDIAWVTPKDLSSLDQPILEDSPEKITHEGLRNCSAQMLPIGTVLFSSRAPIGLVAIAGREMCTNQGFKNLVPGSDVDSAYLYRCMKYLTPAIQHLGRGATFKEVSKAIVEDVEIPLPPLAEQKRIADILDKADAIRRKRAQALELTDQFLQSVFLDMFGDPVTNPKGWDTCAVEELCSEIVDCPHSTPIYSTETTEFPCIRTSDLQAGYLDWSTTKYVSREEYQRRISRLCPTEGDILYSREGERFGIAARVQPNTTPCLGQRMMLFRPDLTQATAGFLWAVLNSRSVYAQARNLVSGSTSPHVNVRDIKQFLVPRPPMALQHSFAAIIAALDSFRAKHAIHASESTELFSSLVQQAFRGEM